MSPVSLLPPVLALFLAVCTSQAMVKFFHLAPKPGRFAAIDGLRGYLAFCVFLHHSCVWYYYARSGIWQVPPSNLYTNFGQTSVTLFFMITGFLFFSKLLDSKTQRIDWLKLFISRFLRLMPLYAFAMMLVFGIVAVLSHFALHEPLKPIVKNVIRWSSFTIFGGPDLNGVVNTNLIIARVTWSLPYEWTFYLSLPMLAILVGVPPRAKYLAFSLAALTIVLFAWRPGWNAALFNIAAFGGGIGAAYAVRQPALCDLANRPITALVALCGLISVLFLFSTTYNPAAILILSAVFISIACGNDFFGALARPASRVLGEMAYSIYLLHGILLFVLFHFVIGTARLSQLSALNHWAIAVCLVPILILTCFATFSVIEQPAMRAVPAVTHWVRRRVRG